MSVRLTVLFLIMLPPRSKLVSEDTWLENIKQKILSVYYKDDSNDRMKTTLINLTAICTACVDDFCTDKTQQNNTLENNRVEFKRNVWSIL